ncbi:MAG TPA: GDP-mannose 4,6-dehydratase [Candidatus Acidoferrales bacterium]|nr:GDP-mannose 4,6-dehydratase [Candidatus Acidoferrales bacterium]
MRALVTGADGFVGQWLVAALLDRDWEVVGAIRASAPELHTLTQTRARDVKWASASITDLERLQKIVADAKPDAVFHLAAQSFVPASNDDPMTTIETNVSGTVCILEAVRREAPGAITIAVGSADAYGAFSSDRLPLSEAQPLAPQNPYAASKAAAELLALQYARAGFCRVVATRSFNHTGPGQRASFAVASFARQIADIKGKRRAPLLEVGDLSPRRDYCDVRDVVLAYVLLAARGESGQVYNVCSGQDRSMAEIVQQLLRTAGIEAEIKQRADLTRSGLMPVIRGDPARINKRTGWAPVIPFDRTLSDMLEFFASAAA